MKKRIVLMFAVVIMSPLLLRCHHTSKRVVLLPEEFDANDSTAVLRVNYIHGDTIDLGYYKTKHI